MAIIGKGDAVVQLRSGRTLTGKPAWLAWKAVHLMLLRGGEQKARTLLEWGGAYGGRQSRQMTQEIVDRA
jgi:NADH dehydrogenase